MASKDRLMLDSWRERRRTMAALKADAEVALPLLVAVRAEAEAAAQAVRDQFSDLPGFPPPCPRCLRSLVYRRVQLSRKKWRWMWFCRGGCGYSVYEAELQHQREAAAH